jgi:hypothetical protein
MPCRVRNERWASLKVRANVQARVGLADSLARDRRFDVHALLVLTDWGCTAELAARILSPLEDEYEACL